MHTNVSVPVPVDEIPSPNAKLKIKTTTLLFLLMTHICNCLMIQRFLLHYDAHSAYNSFFLIFCSSVTRTKDQTK